MADEVEAYEQAETSEQVLKEDSLTFTVDSALLRELGERLVGQPHIALAELVKNSYDADATEVLIHFAPGEDRIEVIDNGHGMTLQEFEDFWMRVGSPHKQEKRYSRKFGRRMTGNKGVGRLSAQFLAHQLEIETVSDKEPDRRLSAKVDWDEAVHAGSLTEAKAEYRLELNLGDDFPEESRHGTRIVLRNLKQEWSSEDIVGLAREIWTLQPPFRSNPELETYLQKSFNVELKSPNQEAVEKFEEQVEAILDIWYARLFGKLLSAKEADADSAVVSYVLEFSDGETHRYERKVSNCEVSELEFEIRVYHLKHRQPHGIKVQDARDYFNDYGGVHVYDSGFHLPYYGPEHDWLGVEMDHSHRITHSKLLPEDLQIKGGLSYLPTNSRLYGVVHVNTAKELQVAEESERMEVGDYLKIQVSRDRLVDNQAYQRLRRVVRAGIDFYAMEEGKRKLEKTLSEQPVEKASEKFERVDEVLDHYRPEIPDDVYDTLRNEVEEAIEASEAEEESIEKRTGLLGSLATAGMSAMAYEHEVQKQYRDLEEVSDELRSLEVPDSKARERLRGIAGRIEEWVQRARSMRELFAPLLDEENRGFETRFFAKSLIRDVCDQMNTLLRGTEVDLSEMNDRLRLPEAGFPEWSAIFQNIFVNAVNAMLDSEQRKIKVISHESDSERHEILVQDTGSGVDLDASEELFKPFVRKLEISDARRQLGAGGSGLGLAIVRMIADNIGCDVEFTEPRGNYSTAFKISWQEK